MRQIRIVSPAIMTGVILYDGKHRRVYQNLNELRQNLLDNLPGYKPKKPIEVYLEGFNGQGREVEGTLSEVLPKAKYFVKGK